MPTLCHIYAMMADDNIDTDARLESDLAVADPPILRTIV
jgi:hypothetical protein